MLRPRWRKVFRDLWLNKNRTVVVVLSIAVGVFAIGTIVLFIFASRLSGRIRRLARPVVPG